MKTNYDMFVETINELALSQGIYQRLKRDIENTSEDDIKQFKNNINKLPQFKDKVDIVMYIEG